MWDACGIYERGVFVLLLFGTEVVICQTNAYGGGGEVAAKERCICFQVFSSDI